MPTSVEVVHQSDKLKKVHEEALISFKEVQGVQQEERLQNIEDRRFVTIAGAQWEGKLQDQFENKPQFEVNKIQLSLDRIKNEYKNNRMTANFEPVNGDENDTLADTCDDLYRATERKSTAKEAYDNAFDEGVSGGIGAWRLSTEFVDEFDPENELQNIIITPQFDADITIFFDLGAKRQDKLDAVKGWALIAMTRKAYKLKYDDDPSSWPQELGNTFFWDRTNPDIVYVAEYYSVDTSKKLVTTFKSLQDEEEMIDDVTEEKREELISIGSEVVSERKISKREVHKYIMSGSKVLSDEGVIAGKFIPIVPFFGKRSYINNIERTQGHVRPAKDMQRLKNMQVSWLAEVAARSGEPKPIFTPGQITGHENIWRDENIDNPAYLTLNPILDKDGNEQPVGPLGYTKAAEVPPATAALLQLTDMDIREMLGDQAQGEKIVSNISGDAVEKIQDRIDMQTFGFMDSFARSIETSGIIWLSIAKDIFTEEGNEGRKLKAVTSQNKSRQIELMRPVIDPETKEVKIENDFSKVNMEITVSVGPSSSTKRKATVGTLTNMLKFAVTPEDQSIITAMIMMNMEGEGVSEAREFYRKKLVQGGVVKPTEDEAKAMQAAQEAEANAEPTPEEQFLLSEAEKNEADALKTITEIDKTIAETGKIESETATNLGELNRADRVELLEMVEELAENNAANDNVAASNDNEVIPEDLGSQITIPDQIT